MFRFNVVSVLLSVEAAFGAQAVSNRYILPILLERIRREKKVEKAFCISIEAITHDMNEKGIAHQAIPKKLKMFAYCYL